MWPIVAPVVSHFFAEQVINHTGLSAFYCAGRQIEQGSSESYRTDVPDTEDSGRQHSWMTWLKNWVSSSSPHGKLDGPRISKDSHQDVKTHPTGVMSMAKPRAIACLVLAMLSGCADNNSDTKEESPQRGAPTPEDLGGLSDAGPLGKPRPSALPAPFAGTWVFDFDKTVDTQ